MSRDFVIRLLVCVVALTSGGPAAPGQSDPPTCDENSLFVPSRAGAPGDGPDPCAGRSYVRAPDENSPYYRWVTEMDLPGQEPIRSPGWQSLLYPYGGGGVLPDVPIPLNYTIDPDDPNGGPHVPVGFRGNRSPLAGLSPGDFLPVGKNLAEHSTCLVPPDGASVSTDWQGTYRPTLDGKVDLVTGLPLVQVTDLELPFGGATFRLTRTRSARRPDNTPNVNGEVRPIVTAPDQWWDWAGMGWMISENPLLVIESALPDIAGEPQYTNYFIVDAHHSIPFQLIPDTGVFEAPPRFRARMTYSDDGEWGIIDVDGDGNNIRGWITRPSQFDIYLYEGALHYTFVAIWEDIPPRKWDGSAYGQDDWKDTTYHDKPTFPPDNWWPYREGSPGWGLPYYGLCTKIEDKYGHSVEIEYCQVLSSEMDDEQTEGCIECQLRTIQKGQIRSIRAYPETLSIAARIRLHDHATHGRAA